jgi:hypothetical protein
MMMFINCVLKIDALIILHEFDMKCICDMFALIDSLFALVALCLIS